MGLTSPGRRRRRPGPGPRSASRLTAAFTARRVGAGATAALVLGLAGLGVVVVRRSRFDVQPARRAAAPFTVGPAVPPYVVTTAVVAVRPCYGPSDTAGVVLDTVVRAAGTLVVTVAVASDRGTAGYVEARPARGGAAACLGRVGDGGGGGGGWSGYVRRVDPALGIVDRVLADSAGRTVTYPDHRAASAAVERAARNVAR